MNGFADRRDGPPGRRAARHEVGRQADRAGPGPALDESLEKHANRGPQARHVLNVNAGSRGRNRPMVFGSGSFKTRSSVRKQGT